MEKTNKVRNGIAHFKTITIHKIEVLKLCFKVGLYKQGLLHDCSKYEWVEFRTGVHYYQGHRSPIDAEKEKKGMSLGWLHHKGVNKHHWEYWMDNTRGGLKPVKMPTVYVVEMFCDRIAASKIYLKDNYTNHSALEYFEKGQAYTAMHPETSELLHSFLLMLSSTSEKETLSFIKHQILHK